MALRSSGGSTTDYANQSGVDKLRAQSALCSCFLACAIGQMGSVWEKSLSLTTNKIHNRIHFTSFGNKIDVW